MMQLVRELLHCGCSFKPLNINGLWKVKHFYLDFLRLATLLLMIQISMLVIKITKGDDLMKRAIAILAAVVLVFGIAGTAQALVLASDISEIYAVGGQDVVIPGADPDLTTYSSLTDPFGGTISFDNDVEKRTVGSSWATWSHGYTGPVLFSQYLPSIRMDFGRSIYGFGFYAEPNSLTQYNVTMGLSGGVTQTKLVDGSGGATFFGFYDSGVDWVEISTPDPNGFAFGEMVMAESYRAVPEPTTMLLFGIGTLGLGVIRKFRK
jgi:hypothetical protein